MRFLLDTNVLSEPVRGRPDAAILDRLETYAGQIATAAPVWHELWFGCLRLPDSRRRDFLTDYLRVIYVELPILAYDARAAEWHARERARLSALGNTPPFVDGQIAAIAAVNQLTLVSRNVRDFTIFNELRVEDWRTGS
jgi:tRNA(fMet)-specific endonuclease VapC